MPSLPLVVQFLQEAVNNIGKETDAAMPNHKRTLNQILAGKGQNIRYADFVSCLMAIGFSVREGKGDHKVVFLDGDRRAYAIQPDKNGNAIAYQVRQVRKMIAQLKMGGDELEI